MNTPRIKVIAISNVFARMMHFEKAGDAEEGHFHTHDHGTLVSSGALRVEILDEANNVVKHRDFVAPAFVFIAKERKHRVIALEDNTVAACIHALRDVDNNILSPEFLIEEKWFADSFADSDNINDHIHLYAPIKRGVKIQPIGRPTPAT